VLAKESSKLPMRGEHKLSLPAVNGKGKGPRGFFA
jgi:hypothetical protein